MQLTRFNYRFVLKTVGFLLIIESLFMMLASMVSFYKHEASGDSLLISCTITFMGGILFRLVGTDDGEKPIGKRESFLVVSLAWVILSAFGMLPYYLSGAVASYQRCLFRNHVGLYHHRRHHTYRCRKHALRLVVLA